MRKIRQACSQAFRYAIVTDWAENNPASELAGALAIQKHTHCPHLVATEFPEFLQCLNEYTGSPITKIATRLLLLTGVRTIEFRAAEWAEFDLGKGLLEVPKSRMKMRRPHLVPLYEWVLILLRQLEEMRGRFKLVFPGRIDSIKPMSEASINQLTKRIGYHGRATGQGFRHTIMHEQGYNTAWIETQLATSIRTVSGERITMLNT